MKRLSKISPRLEELCDKIIDPILSIPPWSLGYPSSLAQSSYYPDSNTITKDEIRAVSEALASQSIYPENTRIRKVGLPNDTIFEVLTASANSGTSPRKISLSHSRGTIRIIYGDHAEEMGKICQCLEDASKYAANNNQKLFLS